MEWIKLFSKPILDRGYQYYKSGRVSKYQHCYDYHYVTVKGSRPYQVGVYISNGEIKRLSCNCPHAWEGAHCKHMAAALYYMEAARILESEELIPLEQFCTNQDPHLTDIVSQNSYQYFDCDSMIRGFSLTRSELDKLSEIIRKGTVVLNRVDIGYYGSGYLNLQPESQGGIARGTMTTQKGTYDIVLYFNREKVTYADCVVPNCMKNYYGDHSYGSQKLCIHQTALLLLLKDHLKKYNPGDVTTRSAAILLNQYRDRNSLLLQKSDAAEHSSAVAALDFKLDLNPRLQLAYNGWNVSFKIVGNKSYVIKNLSQLVTQVDNQQTVRFGSKAEWPLRIENFSEQGKRYYHFIRQIVREEEERKQEYREKNIYFDDKAVEIKDSISLFGRRLDDFFETVGSDTFELIENYRYKKTTSQISCRETTPDISLTIQKDLDQKKRFQGIKITGSFPELKTAPKGAYFLDSQHLNRISQEAMHELEPLMNISDNGSISTRIGRKRLGEFYYHVLPLLKKQVQIVEPDHDEICSYLPPEVTFIFYLDAEESDLICRCDAIYGDEKRDLVKTIQTYQAAPLFRNPTETLEDFRDMDTEKAVAKEIQKLFPCVDSETGCFRCNGEEDPMYRILNGGIATLMHLGEVHATERFKSRGIRHKSNLSVGVSVESQLLNLSISSEDLTLEEMAEVLGSYRKKQRYHRLRNGDFFDLESDTETLEMLNQLMESLQIPLKEFVKGNMKLPAYRTLYLDKMLESCEGAYIQRDRKFKALVKDFKTIEDADFEIPESLQRTLRKYQETGYRWLRTLEMYGFGGILADDMGLGKTLQVITLLLSRQEKSPTLIVTPASLVYNWGEEFKRFAPQLDICLVTGTQKERLGKLKEVPAHQVYITSYDLLKRDIADYEEMTFACEILDEAQYIKNHTTAAAKAVKIINSKQRYALTGTPIENRLSELWSIFDYLMPGYLYSYDKFRKTFETPIVKHQDEARSEGLKRMVAPFILRRLKEQVLRDLPDKLEEIRYVKPDTEQQKLLDAQIAHMKAVLEQTDDTDFNKNKLKILAELVRIRQLCCDPALCFENYHGGSAKREACIELIQQAIEGNHKILVFSQFASMLELLEHDMQKENIPYYKITGSTPKEERIRLVNTFNQDTTPVFFISLKAGGTGLNLTGADMVIHYDPWWNLAVQNQATDRAHRIGQTKVVTVYKMIVKNSIEEKILLMQETKKNLADEILSGETSQLSSMSKEELLALLQME